jgi:hypothetical protein
MKLTSASLGSFAVLMVSIKSVVVQAAVCQRPKLLFLTVILPETGRSERLKARMEIWLPLLNKWLSRINIPSSSLPDSHTAMPEAKFL